MNLHYNLIYINGDRIPVKIADFYRTNSGSFIFEYCENPKYAFPGFGLDKKRYESDILWEQISFRVPNHIRKQHPNIPVEELLKETKGKLITDHFEFLLEVK